ncbi:MAG: thioredoxin domain-containing protein, partial [Opitutaceae bacterium]|nr:thioredoxin domain-containing protein [Opitutaceae bacterium]
SLAVTARNFGVEPAMAAEKLAAILEKLRPVRNQRPRPHLDDKIITAWNGLMISALARAAVSPAVCLQGFAKTYRGAAVRAAEFVRAELYDEDRGVLYRNYREGRGANEAFAEDYAYFIAGLLDLYEATFDDRWLQWADRLQQTMDERFLDGQVGGYFNSAADDASIVLRLKEDYDGAEPAPGSVAAANLLRLAAITHDETRRARGRGVITAAQAVWAQSPQALPEMLCALERALADPPQVVLVGDPCAKDFQALVPVCHERIGPRRALLAVNPAGGVGNWLRERAPWLANMATVDGHAAAYVCEDFTCQAPVVVAAELRKRLYPTVNTPA